MAADDEHHPGQHGENGSELQGGAATRLDRRVLRINTDCDETFGSSTIPAAAAPDAISWAGIRFDGNRSYDGGDDRTVDFEDSSFNPDGNNGRLEASEQAGEYCSLNLLLSDAVVRALSARSTSYMLVLTWHF